jgi:hypothetical protein
MCNLLALSRIGEKLVPIRASELNRRHEPPAELRMRRQIADAVTARMHDIIAPDESMMPAR